VLELPDDTQWGDIVELPVTLPAGEMFQAGRTHPELHIETRVYEVAESRDRGKYLANRPMRFVRTVNVPPPNTIPVTVHLR
jgi:hypothetical protein